jgi:hypothetical protein
MDAVVVGAVTAAPIEGAEPLWFTALCELYDSHGADGWYSFQEQLRARAAADAIPDQAVDMFVAYLETYASDPMQVLASLREVGDQLPAWHQELRQGQGSQEEPAEVWQAYLAENGPAWDGAEESWQQFREWFAYYAAEQGVGASAEGFLQLAEAGDKHLVFAQYGVAVPVTVDTLRALPDEVMQPAVDALLRNAPELAALGEQRLREILAEVTAAHLSTTEGTV